MNLTRQRCEPFEIDVSAWLDDELDRGSQLDLVDHLVRCQSCRRFYAEARALGGVVAAVRQPAGEPAPSLEVWQRIRATAKPRSSGMRTLRIVLPVAAAVVLAIAAGLFGLPGRPTPPPPAAQAATGAEETASEILIGRHAGDMSEERFIALTRELLEADPRYHDAMLRVMEQVVLASRPREGSAEYRTSEADYRPAEDEDRRSRVETAGRLPV